MQFYLEGYRPGDPELVPASEDAYIPGAPFPDEVDVLIVGTGPAGCVLAAQLTAFSDIRTRIVERREGRLQRGQADGVACRTVEMFQAFGLATKMLAEAYSVNESVFWSPDVGDSSHIIRTGRVHDTEDGLSEMPHVIVNQARLQDFLLEKMQKSPSRLEPDYGVEFVALEIDPTSEHPVLVTLRRDNEEFQVRATYVVGCDGARSAVRSAIGRELHGDVANHAWGVLDVLGLSDFPDWRMKAFIQSAHAGNLLLIPREGGNMVRLYVDLGEVTGRDDLKQITVEQVIATAQRVLLPFVLDVREVAWFSVYEIGQRLTDKFDDVPLEDIGSRIPQVFVAGDACHTHSAKAGQGMNVSMQDGFNLGWKLGAVLDGRSGPALLHTYSAERQAIAQGLIDFDKEWSTQMAQPPRDLGLPERGGIERGELQAAFVESGRYTAGLATQYTPSVITADSEHQTLATGFPLGMRFHSAPVVRIGDAKPVQLGHTHEADGRWRLYAFVDSEGSRAATLFDHLQNVVLPRFTPSAADPDAVLDVRAVFPQGHRELNLIDLHRVLRPQKGTLGLRDYEKAFAIDLHGGDIYKARGIDPMVGALVIVRPDQYVAHVLPLDAVDELDAFLGGCLLRATN
ncbi:FAD-binding monooxygenase [Alpinimonas psychrophila]|uniref:Phenol 2-monooxygenase n=1 Tax=Alpinimonas psychrophila TaxID=748908 RepID=A0A7W3JVF1_9MICO|nr:FAD-dependent monooxygenase [Alpinimonas psychrophila]MBA8830006.1 phenol 2-monooxygenase [Alpinimonas psychrophila]